MHLDILFIPSPDRGSMDASFGVGPLVEHAAAVIDHIIPIASAPAMRTQPTYAAYIGAAVAYGPAFIQEMAYA